MIMLLTAAVAIFKIITAIITTIIITAFHQGLNHESLY